MKIRGSGVASLVCWNVCHLTSLFSLGSCRKKRSKDPHRRGTGELERKDLALLKQSCFEQRRSGWSEARNVTFSENRYYKELKLPNYMPIRRVFTNLLMLHFKIVAI